MSGLVALLRRAGVLAGIAGRWRSAGTEMLDDLAALHRLAEASEEVRTALERGELPDDPAFRRGFAAWLGKHGHRGAYESDIARPRYREQPALVLRSLATVTPPTSRPRRPLRALLLAPVGWLAARALRARESLRSSAMVGFERLRSAMLKRAHALALAGALPSADALWSLELDEVRRLDEGFRPDATSWRLRAAEEVSLRGYDFPDLVHRFDDLEAYRRRPEGGPAPIRLRGIPLTAGVVRGRAWVLAEPSVEPPGGFRAEDTILVARAADAGWIPTFGLVAAVVIEIGGDLSHGSIVLREIDGLSAYNPL
jgi:pyruvate,water dikinase